jgi:hypothetical protein
MSLLNFSPIGTAINAVFGGKGLVGGIADTLESTGIIRTPEDKLKTQQALQDFETRLRDQDNTALATVNKTIQDESDSEHWLQWAWRPVFGFTAAGVIIYNYIIAPFFRIPQIEIPSDVWNTILVVLGVTAGTRGYEKIVKAQNN